jgi:GNAT superfamily N-acetyltransferase
MHPAELGELEAFRDVYAAAPSELGARSKKIGGALCVRLEPLSTVTMFNRVLGIGLEEPATEAQLDEALDFVRGVEAYVTVAPDARPQDLGEQLEARGLPADRGWTKFSRSASDPPQASTELRVERDESGEAFAEAATRGFGVPDLFLDWLLRLAGRDGWQCFAAFDGDRPAAAGALFVTGRVGWCGIGATVPEHRGKGGQGALLAARVWAAAEAGCEVVVTETGEPVDGLANGSYRNIVRAGFEPLYVRRNYLSASTAAS